MADILRPIDEVVNQDQPLQRPQDSAPAQMPKSLAEFTGQETAPEAMQREYPGSTPSAKAPEVPDTPMRAFGGEIQTKASQANLASSREARVAESQPTTWDQVRTQATSRLSRMLMAYGATSGNPALMQYGWQMGMQAGYKQMLPVVSQAMQRYEAGDTPGAIGIYDQALQRAQQEGWHPTVIQQLLKTRMDLGNMMGGVNRLRNALMSVRDSADPFQIVAAMSMGGVDPKVVGEYLQALRTGKWTITNDPNNGRVWRLNNITGSVDEISHQLIPGSNYVNAQTISKEEHDMARSFSGGRFSDAAQLYRAEQAGDPQAQMVAEKVRKLMYDKLTSGKIPPALGEALGATGGLPDTGLMKDVGEPALKAARDYIHQQTTAGAVMKGSAMVPVAAATAQAVLAAKKEEERAQALKTPVAELPGFREHEVFDSTTGMQRPGIEWQVTGGDLKSGRYVALNKQDSQLLRFNNRAIQQMDRVQQILKDVYANSPKEGFTSNWVDAIRQFGSKTGISPQQTMAEFETLKNMLNVEVGRIESGQARALVTLLNLVGHQLPGMKDTLPTAKTRMDTLNTSLVQLRQQLLRSSSLTPFGERTGGYLEKKGVKTNDGSFTTSSGAKVQME